MSQLNKSQIDYIEKMIEASPYLALLPVTQEAVDTFGKENEKIVCIEELSELIKELTKDLRGQGNIDHIAEEYADVMICLSLVDIIYQDTDMDKLVDEHFQNKLKRLFKRSQEGVDHE